MPFEPEIIGFLCNWCSYEGADAAGRARLAYPPNLKAVRVMCSGRVDPRFILSAFKSGADGVLVLACPSGTCHYRDGNRQAFARHVLLKKVLSGLGVAEDRIGFESVSTGDGARFVEIVHGMTQRVRSLGPLDIVSPEIKMGRRQEAPGGRNGGVEN